MGANPDETGVLSDQHHYSKLTLNSKRGTAAGLLGVGVTAITRVAGLMG